jgi:medium-chain acyl-[acyl-carrier-protein] hydrolase
VGKTYSKEYELHYYDVDSNLKCSITTILNILSDIGTKQSEELGSGMAGLLKSNMTWVFYNYNVKVNRYPMYGEKLLVKTEPVGFKKFYAIRKYEIKDESGNLVVEANAIFLLINLEKRRTMRIPSEQYEVYGLKGDIEGEFKIPKLEKLKDVMYEINFSVRYTDIDFNKHVNNTKYVEWAIESLPEDIVKNYKLEEIKVTFEKECKYGEEIKSLSSFTKEENGSLTTIHRIETLDNKELTKLIAHWRKY